MLSHGLLAFGLLFFVTIAAFVYLRLFNFSAHPFQFVYIVAYVIVGIVTGIYLLKDGTGLQTP